MLSIAQVTPVCVTWPCPYGEPVIGSVGRIVQHVIPGELIEHHLRVLDRC